MSYWYQKVVTIRPKSRGFHLVTDEVVKTVPEMKKIKMGLMHLLVQHTSASISINESYDPEVRTDMEMVFNRIVPRDLPYEHTMEGPDDMPAHAKTAILGCTLSLPITDGRLNLGTWQGIYLNEHRDRARSRSIVITLNGTTESDAGGTSSRS